MASSGDAGAERTTVAVVGFGPVGMVLAGLLGRRGIQVLAIDRAWDVFPTPRAAHLDHTVLRTLQELGVVEGLLPQLVPNSALVLADEHLSALATIPAADSSRSGYTASSYFYQPDFDRYLDREVSSLPTVRVRRGVEMVSLSQHEAGVRILANDEHGRPLEIDADWVIGCDGARSLVRDQLGVDLESLGFDERWLVLDLKLDAEGLPQHALQVCDPRRAWVSNPVPGGRYRVEMRIGAEEDDAGLREDAFLEEFLRPLIGARPFEIERNAVYEFHALVATRWRSDRVFLAGDAAHQMPPFLGQGMVSGIRDAQNLAWKLAGVIHGRYPSEILDTYQSERSPHIRSVTESAVEVGRFVSAADAEEVAERNLRLRSGDLGGAPTFRIPDLERGPLVGPRGGGVIPQPADPETGLPHLDEMLGDGFVVLSAEPPADSPELDWWRREWSAAVKTPGDLGYAEVPIRAWLAAIGAQVAILRPDRAVLDAGESLSALIRPFSDGREDRSADDGQARIVAEEQAS